MRPRHLFACAILACAALAPGQAQNPTRAAAGVLQVDGPSVKVWFEGSPIIDGSQPVRVFFETEDDAYVLVGRVNTDGRLTILFPRSPRDNAMVAGGDARLVMGQHGSSFVLGERDGAGFVFALAAYTPFDLRQLTFEDRWGYQAVTNERPLTGNPETIVSRLAAALAPNARTAVSYDVATYFSQRRLLAWAGAHDQCLGYSAYGYGNYGSPYSSYDRYPYYGYYGAYGYGPSYYGSYYGCSPSSYYSVCTSFGYATYASCYQIRTTTPATTQPPTGPTSQPPMVRPPGAPTDTSGWTKPDTVGGSDGPKKAEGTESQGRVIYAGTMTDAGRTGGSVEPPAIETLPRQPIGRPSIETERMTRPMIERVTPPEMLGRERPASGHGIAAPVVGRGAGPRADAPAKIERREPAARLERPYPAAPRTHERADAPARVERMAPTTHVERSAPVRPAAPAPRVEKTEQPASAPVKPDSKPVPETMER